MWCGGLPWLPPTPRPPSRHPAPAGSRGGRGDSRGWEQSRVTLLILARAAALGPRGGGSTRSALLQAHEEVAVGEAVDRRRTPAEVPGQALQRSGGHLGGCHVGGRRTGRWRTDRGRGGRRRDRVRRGAEEPLVDALVEEDREHRQP